MPFKGRLRGECLGSIEAFIFGLCPLGESLGLIVNVGSCKDNSMSVRGCMIIGEDERGVKV